MYTAQFSSNLFWRWVHGPTTCGRNKAGSCRQRWWYPTNPRAIPSLAATAFTGLRRPIVVFFGVGYTARLRAGGTRQAPVASAGGIRLTRGRFHPSQPPFLPASVGSHGAEPCDRSEVRRATTDESEPTSVWTCSCTRRVPGVLRNGDRFSPVLLPEQRRRSIPRASDQLGLPLFQRSYLAFQPLQLPVDACKLGLCLAVSQVVGAMLLLDQSFHLSPQ